MPKIKQKSFVDLTAYRQKNGLLQKDIAIYLNVTRGYISMVEKGSSKLSNENINKLIDAQKTQGWEWEPLFPQYSRLCKTFEYIKQKNYDKEDFNPEDLIPKKTFLQIKNGKGEITEIVANIICQAYPEINKSWLLTGEGKFLIKPQQGLSKIELLEKQVLQLRKDIKECQKKISFLLKAQKNKFKN